MRIVDSDATHESELFGGFEFAEIIHVGDNVQIHIVEILDVICDTFTVNSLVVDVQHVEDAPDTAELHTETEAGFIFIFQKITVLDTAGDTGDTGIAVVRPFEFEEEGNRGGTLIYQLGSAAFGHAVDRRFDGGTGTPAVAVHCPGDHAGLDAGQRRRTFEVDGSGNALLIGEQRVVITCHEAAPAQIGVTEIETVFVLVKVEIHIRTNLVLTARQADEVEEDVGRSHADLGFSAVAGSDFPDLGGLEVTRVIDRVAEVEGNRSAYVAADAKVELLVLADDGKAGDFGGLIVVRGVF